jgi:hypothetical protein
MSQLYPHIRIYSRVVFQDNASFQTEQKHVLLFLPHYLFPGDNNATGIAEINLTAFGTELKFFIALRAVRIHVVFVVQIVAIAVVTGKFGAIRSKFLDHFGTAFTAYSSFHDVLSY